MATKGNNNAGKKQSRSQRRRDTENAVFGELADLLPVSQDMRQDKLSILRLTVAYLKLKDGLETDEQDLEECLADVDESPGSSSHGLYIESEQPPIAMLDNEGNLIAGSLYRNQTSKEPTSITVPDQVMSELEEQFLSGSEHSDDPEMCTRKEKLQKYKEGLEQGMQEFLSQGFSDIQSDYNNSSSPRMPSGERGQILCLESSKSAGEDKVITKTPCSGVISKKGDQHLTLSEPIQESSLILEAATGFILSLDKHKRVLFVSENVSEYLGHCQSFVIGQDVSEFIYEKDYPELERQMSDIQFQQEGTRLQLWMIKRTFYLAMKFCFQKSGSRMKYSGFQLYRWHAKLRLYKDKTSGDICVKGLTALCCPLQRGSILSLSDNANFFMIRFSIKEARILYCDPKVQDLLGYSPSELIGVKHSDLKHPSDSVMCKYNNRKLPKEGKSESGYYRLLSRTGAWVWMYSNYDVIYNKDGSPDVLVMRSIVVSQAEARCVLSRESQDFENIRNDFHTDGLSTHGMSGPTLASIAFDKKRKKRRTSVNNLPSSILTVIVSSTENASFSRRPDPLPKKTLHQLRLQKSITSSLQQLPSSQLYPSQNGEESKTRIKAITFNTDNTQTRYQRLLYSSPVADDSDKIMDQTLEQHSISQDINMDTYQSPDCSSSYVSSLDPLASLTDSESSTEIPLSQQMINISSMTTSSSSPLPFSSSEQEWSIDSLLFDTDLQDNSLLPLSNRSEVTCPSSGQIHHDAREMDSAKFCDNDQLVQNGRTSVNQENTLSSNNNPVSTSGGLSTQLYSPLLMTDDQSLSGVLDFLTEELSPASSALMMPSSGDVMLSFHSAPQPIKPRQSQAVKTPVNTFDSPNLAPESENNSKKWLPSVKAIVSSYEALNKKVTSDQTVTKGNFKFYKSNCDPPPVVSGQSDILFSPGKLDYPPLHSMPRHHRKGIGVFHNNFQQNQRTTSSPVIHTTQGNNLGLSCKQNDHNKFEIIKDTGLASENFVHDKLYQGSVCQDDYGSSVGKLKNTPAERKKQTLISTSKAKAGISNPARSSVPGFCEDLGKDITSFDSSSANVINNDILVMRSQNSSASSCSSENVTSLQKSVGTAVKLPEDLADLELDGDIAVILSENWTNYL